MDRGVLVRVRVPATPGERLACQPGQFYLLADGSFLRRCLFPSHIDGDILSFWGHPWANHAIAWLATQPVGAALDLLGPLGRGFSIHPAQRRLLLVAEDRAVSPLLALIGPQLDRQGSVELLLEAKTAGDLLPAALLAPAVEYYTATTDGSAGHPGTLEEPLRAALLWADAVAAAGSPAFLRRLGGLLHEVRFGAGAGFAQVVAPVDLPCGVGACLACLVESGHGWHRACQRGPVFDLVELTL